MIERSGVCLSPPSRWFAAFLPTPPVFHGSNPEFCFLQSVLQKISTYTSLYIYIYEFIYNIYILYIYILFVGEILLTAVGSLNQHVATRWWDNAHLATAASCRPPGPQWPAPAVPTTRRRMPWAWWRPRRKRRQGLGMDDFGHFFGSFHWEMWFSPENRMGGRMSPPSGIAGLGGRWRCRTPLRSSQNPLVL